MAEILAIAGAKETFEPLWRLLLGDPPEIGGEPARMASAEAGKAASEPCRRRPSSFLSLAAQFLV